MPGRRRTHEIHPFILRPTWGKPHQKEFLPEHAESVPGGVYAA